MTIQNIHPTTRILLQRPAGRRQALQVLAALVVLALLYLTRPAQPPIVRPAPGVAPQPSTLIAGPWALDAGDQ